MECKTKFSFFVFFSDFDEKHLGSKIGYITCIMDGINGEVLGVEAGKDLNGMTIALGATKQLRDLDQELQLFYDYVRGSPAQTNFTKELDATISRMKQEKEERKMYLTYTSRMMEFHRDGYEEGLHTGREQGISIGLERGREEGISLGFEQGAYEKALETARKLLARGDSPAEIAELLNLPVLQIRELQNT